MADAQRTDYGSKKGEIGHDKEVSSKPLEMTKAGGANKDGSGGPTGSCRSYPKGGKLDMRADFTPIKKGPRTGTDWVVGGV